MSEAQDPPPPSEDERGGFTEPLGPNVVGLASADRYRALIEAADEAILVAAFDGGRCIEANPAACELFGASLENLTARSLSSLAPQGDAELAKVLSEITERERAYHPNLTLCRTDASSFVAELRAKAFESGGAKLVLVIIRDVTLRVEREDELARAYQSLKETQARLLHSGKLAAIGQIAGGVAHEVNNPATFILTNLRVLREHVGVLRGTFSRLRRIVERVDVAPAETLAAVEIIATDGSIDAILRESNEMVDDNLDGIERIASIVADLRTFSRIEQDDVRHVVMNDLVDVACNLAYAEIRHRARLIKELKRLPAVSAEPGKLAQVFTTLLVHAAHSIEEGAANENEIRVSTDLEGGFIVVAIEDTGVPIPIGLRDRLFQPFYEAGKDEGYGIGLSLCAEIVRLHGGTIDLKAEPGKSSRFEVRLPAVAPKPPTRPPEPASPRPKASGERARVLVIDDDVAVLRAYRRMLASRHDVVLAGGGAEGLDTLAKDTNFDVILCDVMMPEVDGPMVYEALSARSPDLVSRMVFCSGGAFTPRAKQFLGSVKNPFLPKPIDSEALERLIDRARELRKAKG